MSGSGAGTFERLKPDVFEVLLVLESEELHGYGILKALEGRGIGLAASLLYRKLKRLMEQGLVEESPRAPGPDEDSRRRYYRLTPRGLAVARAEAQRILELASNRDVRRLASAEGGDG